MHLRFDMRDAYEAGATDHPQQIMSDLGISYYHSTPQSIADQWWFWCCENVPEPLPPYLTELKVDPRDCVGQGLDNDLAESIFNFQQTLSK